MQDVKVMLLILAAALPQLAGAQVPVPPPATVPVAVRPFSADYFVQWHGINVGISALQLKAPDASGEYQYLSRSNARGIFRVIFSEEIIQDSTMLVRDGHTRPLRYRADDGTPSTDKDISLDFDWHSNRVRGIAENKPVDMALKADTQDPMSVQIELMLALMRQQPPATIWLADKDEVKEFIYTDEGKARIQTELGDLDTIVLSSKRPGGNRITRLWFAPSLGFVPVQAQRTRDGKTEWTMKIRSLHRPEG